MKRTTLTLLTLLIFLPGLKAQLTFSTRVLKDSLFIPWELFYGPDDHIWFTQKNGYICRMDTAGKHVDTLYHEPSTVAIKESGMLGMALHPDFANQPYVYVVWEYLNPAGDYRERIERYTYSASANTLTSPTVLFDSTHGYRFHNGSRIVIVGDKMFVSVGDATDYTNPQNLNSINGKIIRLNLDGSVPSDNPFPGNPIWTWGHRNPQGLVYANNILYSSEHGNATDDEINIIQKGHNYGWPNVEGYCDKPNEMDFCRDSNVVEPKYAWTPCIAPCGIDYYHHSMFPTLRNSLLLCSLKDKHLYQLQLSESFDSIITVDSVAGFNYGRLRDLCISPEGKIFVSTSNSDPNDTGAKIDRIIEMYNPDYNVAKYTLLFYPNPTKDYIYLDIPTACNSLHYTVYTTDGRKALDGTLGCGRPKIYIGVLAQGDYVLSINTDSGRKYHCFIVRE